MAVCAQCGKTVALEEDLYDALGKKVCEDCAIKDQGEVSKPCGQV
ncbi:MAG: hypothetical protein ACYC4E_02190 [Carboxydocellales bacterium]